MQPLRLYHMLSFSRPLLFASALTFTHHIFGVYTALRFLYYLYLFEEKNWLINVQKNHGKRSLKKSIKCLFIPLNLIILATSCFFCFANQILTDAALLRRQRKEIEELRSKLLVRLYLVILSLYICSLLDSTTSSFSLFLFGCCRALTRSIGRKKSWTCETRCYRFISVPIFPIWYSGLLLDLLYIYEAHGF